MVAPARPAVDVELVGPGAVLMAVVTLYARWRKVCRECGTVANLSMKYCVCRLPLDPNLDLTTHVRVVVRESR